MLKFDFPVQNPIGLFEGVRQKRNRPLIPSTPPPELNEIYDVRSQYSGKRGTALLRSMCRMKCLQPDGYGWILFRMEPVYKRRQSPQSHLLPILERERLKMCGERCCVITKAILLALSDTISNFRKSPCWTLRSEQTAVHTKLD